MSRFKLRIDGPDGKIETVINDPGPTRRGLALIAHPHPLHGGTLDNKVVTTIANTLFESGYVAVRPNFRGVGLSEGEYDHGEGEVADMLAVLSFVRERYPDLPLILAGFSFGAANRVCSGPQCFPPTLRIARQIAPQRGLFLRHNSPRRTRCTPIVS